MPCLIFGISCAFGHNFVCKVIDPFNNVFYVEPNQLLPYNTNLFFKKSTMLYFIKDAQMYNVSEKYKCVTKYVLYGDNWNECYKIFCYQSFIDQIKNCKNDTKCVNLISNKFFSPFFH